jgi:UDP-N-acetylmuramate dehydrogenase
LNQKTGIKLQENVPLAPFTTLKIGGPARFFVRAENEEQVVAAVEFAETRGLPLFVLGGGSNVLVSDEGFNGLVLHICNAGVPPAVLRPSRPQRGLAFPNFTQTRDQPAGRQRFKRQGAAVTLVTAAAGEDWDAFVAYCIDNDLAGVECLSGIPGLVAGTPVQNVGAYGQEVSETIVTVRCFDRIEKRIVELSNVECGFEYRKSIFNSSARDRYIVFSVTYALTKGGAPKIAYKDLRDRFPDRSPSLRETREAVLKIRRAKSMVIDPGDPNSRSAGSFFKNPVVPAELVGSMRLAAGGGDIPTFPATGGNVKIPAAWLIERAGFGKGYRLGRAAISTNHSLALVNLGGATASEIVELKRRIQDGIEEKFGILLQVEPIFVGFPEAVLKN